MFNIKTYTRVYRKAKKFAEAEVREFIDDLLRSAGWSVQDYQHEDFSASLGIGVREFQLKTGVADYLLFINPKVVGVIEAKPVGHSLGGVDYQSAYWVTQLFSPYWKKITGGVYTYSVHNLYGMHGVIGGIATLGLVAAPLWQLTGIILSVILAVLTGIIVGFIVSRLGRKQTPYDDQEEFNVPE